MKKPANQPAFPCQSLNSKGIPSDELNKGITIRDYFAAQAIGHVFEKVVDTGISYNTEKMAKDAYEIADAMMIRREKDFSLTFLYKHL